MPRRTFFLGKAEYMKSAFTAKLFPAMGMIPLERDQTRQAMAALEVAAGVLGRGHPLAIYPEGTRSRDGLLHKGHTGVAQLALMSGAPIVPGRARRDRPHPADRRQACRDRSAGPSSASASPSTRRRYGGSRPPSAPAADRRPDGVDPPPQRPGGQRRLRRRRAAARARRHRDRLPGPHRRWRRAPAGPRPPASPSRSACAAVRRRARRRGPPACAARSKPDGAVRFVTEVAVSTTFQPASATTPLAGDR